jgi:hypothetical protein
MRDHKHLFAALIPNREIGFYKVIEPGFCRSFGETDMLRFILIDRRPSRLYDDLAGEARSSSSLASNFCPTILPSVDMDERPSYLLLLLTVAVMVCSGNTKLPYFQRTREADASATLGFLG